MKIKSLKLKEWNQFTEVNIEFHERLTILTGANGSGKSTIARVLSRLIGWDYKEIKLPKPVETINEIELRDYQSDSKEIGTLQINDDTKIELTVPLEQEVVTYDVKYNYVNSPVSLKGVNITSHRLPYQYKKLDVVPSHAVLKNEAAEKYMKVLKNRMISNTYYNPLEEHPTVSLKSALISLAVYGQGNDYVENDKEALDLFLKFNSILCEVLPPNIGFNKIKIKKSEVILETQSGEFLLDAVSGGLGSIIDIAWQIFLCENNNDEFVVLIDEVENHLHPSMQRSLLPNLLRAFPTAQFVVTTHSPFVVNAVEKSYVYALEYNEQNKVFSTKLDFSTKTYSAMDILRNVLGVPVTMPIWLEDKISQTIEQVNTPSLNIDTYKQLKELLINNGLINYLPEAVDLWRKGDGTENEEN